MLFNAVNENDPYGSQFCALQVPPQHRFGLYKEERGSPAAEPPTRQNPETPVRILKARPWYAALQDYQLLPEARLPAISSAFGWTAAANAHSKQRSIDLSPCCRTARRLMLFNPVNGNDPSGSQFCALQGIEHMSGISDALLTRIVPRLAEVPGVVAVALGGSRARGRANATSDYDIGLYYGSDESLDTDLLLAVARSLVEDPSAAAVTSVGAWGPRIVGGGWLTIEGTKVDLLYRGIEAVRAVISDCRAGRISIDYQPGHPHGFCSAIWMGELALCQPLHDPQGAIAQLKTSTSPYPDKLREALLNRFMWEVLFSIENGEIAV